MKSLDDGRGLKRCILATIKQGAGEKGCTEFRFKLAPF